MKKTKTTYAARPAWEFGREIQQLEEQSRKGWQLTKGGCFHSKFRYDDTVRYRYALDFNQDIKDPMRYRETFQEQDWEYINSTFNGWHYFRKAYDPSLPEEEYQIYTDTASLQEMAARWKRLAYAMGGLELAVGALNLAMNLRHPTIYSICLGLGCVLLGSLLLLSAKWIGQPARPRRGRLFLPVLALLLVALVFGALRANGFTTQTEYLVPEEDNTWELCFEVKLPDVYTLDLNVDAPEAVSVRLEKDGSAGSSPAYAAEGTKLDQSVHLFLSPGTYSLRTQYLPGAEPGLSGQFHYELN